QHTMIAQLIVDNGGLFDSWQPYAELTTFTYHFGFHAQAAAFHWITKLPMHQAILWVGQILNGLAAIFLFPLALRLNRNPWCGVIAVLIAGLLVPMPMFYVNWGRYTQLAGQAILPAAIYLSWAILEAKSTNWRALIPAWVALGGLALTHYRVLIFAVIFFAVFALLQFRTLGLRRVIVRTFWLGLGAGLLFLPWFVHVFAGRLMNILRHQVTTFPAPAASSTARGRNSSPDLSQYLPPLLWLALPVIIAWGLWRRHKGFAIISLWWYVVYLAANPQWFNLPGANAIGNLTVLIAAYFPISIMIGAEACWLIEDLAECSPISNITRKLQLDRLVIPSIILCLLIAGFGLWGMNQRRKEPSPEKYALATRSDSIAFDWLRQNTDNDARFLVNAIFHPTLGSAGSDGGWWLPLLANRQTTLPPSPYTSEQGPTSNYIVWIDELTKQILAEGINHPRTITMLRDRNITHVYIGQKQGSINTKAATIRPDELLVSPYFFPIYHQDRVWIFEFEP
ncbi:MAG: hypothetical protein JXA78_09480, partial [Anaerolineales bacterium]|nr:hypothetical protein [Anaerolineales bacterium]